MLLGTHLLPELSEFLTALGAFATGIAAIMATIWGMHVGRRRAAADCDHRIEQLGKAFKAGMKVQPRRTDNLSGR